MQNTIWDDLQRSIDRGKPRRRWLTHLWWVGQLLSQVTFERRRLLYEYDQNC
jgi:hypothetical protein